MSRKLLILISSILLFALVVVGAYSAWYTYHRHEVIAQLEKCDYVLTHPEASPKMRAPDGTFVPVMTPCLMQPVPPSLWDLVRGRMTFEGVQERMRVNPYSLTDILLGRYTLGPDITFSCCDQSATTTDYSTFPSSLQEQPYVPPNPIPPVETWVSATGTPISLLGFSFELPAGWRGTVYSSAYSEFLHAFVQIDSSDRGFTIDCPPAGKGLEAATRLSSEARSFTTDGTDYSVAFEKWTAPVNDPWYFLWVRTPQSGDSSNGSSRTYCLAQGSATPDIEEAMRTMYESWK